jgi:hypothetical protein
MVDNGITNSFEEMRLELDENGIHITLFGRDHDHWGFFTDESLQWHHPNALGDNEAFREQALQETIERAWKYYQQQRHIAAQVDFINRLSIGGAKAGLRHFESMSMEEIIAEAKTLTGKA